ncbi:hypothetical protein, partial [Nonomuraea dietziae]|uniref:hypothetical protein n=1 Tax=Nonomuraea dietziae TaxID=65515 RepID=UPI0031D93530
HSSDPNSKNRTAQTNNASQFNKSPSMKGHQQATMGGSKVMKGGRGTQSRSMATTMPQRLMSHITNVTSTFNHQNHAQSKGDNTTRLTSNPFTSNHHHHQEHQTGGKCRRTREKTTSSQENARQGKADIMDDKMHPYINHQKQISRSSTITTTANQHKSESVIHQQHQTQIKIITE